MKKKLIKPICVLLALFMLVPSATFADNTQPDYGYEQTLYNLMVDLGLYQDNLRMDEYEEPMNRKSAAAIFSKFFGVLQTTPIGTNAVSKFSDVSSEDSFVGSINTAVEIGLIQSYRDGKFRPDGSISTEDTIRGLVMLLGWNEYVAMNGNTPEAYRKIALKQGLLRGIEFKDKNAVTKSEFTKMLYNSFSSEYMKVIGYGTKKTIETEKDGLLPNRLDIEVSKGIVWSTENINLYGIDKMSKGNVNIEGKIYKTLKSADDFIGHRVEFYYKNENIARDNTIIHISDYKTKLVKLFTEDIDYGDVTKSNFTYNDGSGSNHHIEIAENATFILNGEMKSFYSADEMTPENGNITFVDSNNDDCYDVVQVESYFNMFVEKVFYDNYLYIYEKRKNTARKSLKIDIDDKSIKCEFFKDGEATDYKSITPDTVLSVVSNENEENSGTCYKIYISDKTLSGSISNFNRTEKEAEINFSTYKLDKDFDFSEMDISPGKQGICYLNSFNAIIAFEEEGEFAYGFLTTAKKVGLSKYQVKIYTQSGEFEVYSINKLWIDGDTYKNDDMLTKLKSSSTEFLNEMNSTWKADVNWGDSSGYEQIIKFAVQNKKLSKIDTVVNGNEIKGLKLEIAAIKQPDGNKNFLSKYTGVNSISNKDCETKIDCGIDKNIKFIRVPDTLSNERGFKAGFVEDRSYETLGVFDLDEDINYPSLIIEFTKGNTASTVKDSEWDNLMFVEKVTKRLNEDDEETTYITGFKLKTAVKSDLVVTIDCSFHGNFSLSSLKPGDVISWNTNASGEASTLRKVFSQDGSGSLLTKGNNATARDNEYRIFYATVLALKGDFWKLRIDNSTVDVAGNYTENFLIEVGKASQLAGRIYIFDANKKTVEKSSLDAIKAFKDVGENDASKIIIFNVDTTHYSAVIYK